MSNSADERGEIVKLLEQAFALADELGDGNTAFLIERALDEARSQQFRLGIGSAWGPIAWLIRKSYSPNGARGWLWFGPEIEPPKAPGCGCR
jgi:hypothetical protein